jgi:hypothetical protein
MNEATFLAQIKRTNGVYEKGVVVKTGETSEADAKQGFHAYFGAYGYGHDPNTDYVMCYIISDDGRVLGWEKDDRRPVPEPETEQEAPGEGE